MVFNLKIVQHRNRLYVPDIMLYHWFSSGAEMTYQGQVAPKPEGNQYPRDIFSSATTQVGLNKVGRGTESKALMRLQGEH